MNEWKETTLGKLAEVQTGPFGSQLKNEQYISGGTPVVTVEHIKNFLIEDFVYPSVTAEDKDTLSRYVLKSGDIVFSRVGSVDLSALVKEHQDGWLFSSRMLRVRVKEKLDTNFLSYYLRQPSIRQFIINISVGSTMPSINTEILKSLPIVYCSLEEQKEIADVLSCLDRKIKNLRRQNETLEAIAQTLFKHWFIDFEFPDADGKPYKSSGGEMIDSAIGDIPEGWQVGKLGDIGQVITGKTPSTQSPELWGYDLPFITPTDFKNYGKYILDAERRISQLASSQFKRYVIPANSIVVTCIGSDMGKVAKTAISCVTNQQINSIIPFENFSFHEYIFNYLKNQYKLLRNIALGGSTMPIINKSAFSNIEIILPSLEILNLFENIVDPLNEKIINNQNQIQTLTKTRDALLPKLMSGQLRIEE